MTRRIATAVLLVAALAGAWGFLWPAQFGGQATWLVVEGAQLEPSYSDGDLVLARAQPAYAAGVLVAADAGEGPVLGLVGDLEGQILGTPWLHLAGVGDAMITLAAVVLSWPFLLAAAAAGAASILIPRQRAARDDEPGASTAERHRSTHTLAS
jgi:hypothetical protein